MYKFLIICMVGLMSVSCATLINGKDTMVYVYTEKPSKIVYGSDTILTLSKNDFNAAGLSVSRNKEPLKLEVLTDSLKKQVEVKSKISPSFYLNFYGLIGFPIDLLSNRMYSYKTPLVLDENLNIEKKISTKLRKDMIKRNNLQTSERFSQKRKYSMPKQGSLYLNISVPYINHFLLSPDFENRKSNFGFMGIGGGFDYYYKGNRFFNITVAGAMDFMLPFPAPMDRFGGEYKDAWSAYALFSHNHRKNRFSFGYGLSFGRNVWRYEYLEEDNNENDIIYRKFNTSLGLTFDARYYFSNNFNVGLNYRPTFVRLKSRADKDFKYEHLISLDFAFKIRLYKGK